MKLPIVKHILVFTTWGQKCPHSEPEQFTFDNFQSNHPVGPYMTLFLVEKKNQNLEASRFFFTFNTLFLARAFLMPVLFFVMNKHARRHVKRTF